MSGTGSSATSPWDRWTHPAFLVGVALLLRLAWAALVPVQPVSDSVVYDLFATSLAEGRGYAYPDGGLTVFWPVGTSAAYALIYSIFGRGFAAIAVFQALVGAAIVGLTFALGARHFGHRAGAGAACIVAAWPLMIQFTTILASELLFSLLVLAALWVWGSRRPGWIVRSALAGVLIGAATYVRPIAWPLLLLLPAVAWLSERDLRRQAASALVAGCAAALLFAPWVLRNHALFGEFVLVSANGGTNLWMGNNPESTGAYMPIPATPGMNEVQRDRHLGRLATQFIREQPLEYLKLCVRRLGITYSRETIGVVWNERGLGARAGSAVLQPLKLLSTAYWWAVLGLATLGLWKVLRRQRFAATAPALLVVLAFLFLIPVLTVGQDRYHVPINALLAILAGVAVTRRTAT